MYHTTGLSRDAVEELCATINREVTDERKTWPPILGLFKAVVVSLTYLRRNRVQHELAETYEVSQSTISRAICAVTPLLPEVLAEHIPTADELDPHTPYIVDGALLPCWSWATHPELYSGKHKTTGMNVQVACTLSGSVVWISDPVPGSRHDSHCLRESRALATLEPGNWIGDKGYVGNNMITPIKKPSRRSRRKLLDWQGEFNTQINKVRWHIEQAIANFKTWRCVHTDYRRPIGTFPTTISAVVALHFYATA